MIALALLSGEVESRAQPSAAAPAKPAREKEAEKPAARTQAVEQAEPDILYVLDAEGKYVPLINHSLEEIRRALLALEGGPAGVSRPRFRLKNLAATGTVERDHAVLTVELEIDASDDNWVRVPLRLGGLVLDRPADIEGEGQHLLDYETASHEHVAWFRGTTDKPRRVVLHALAPIERQAGRRVLRINAPRAVTSQLTLKVPQADVVAEVAKDSVLSETRKLDGATEFMVTGLSGDFSIAWQRPDQARVDAPAVLSVDGQVVAQIDGRGIRTSAALRVNAFGREFGDFRVRLPRGATLLPDNAADYTVAPVDVEGAADHEPQVVEVRLKAKTSGPLLVKLVTDQGHDVTRGGSLELGGFEVLGAVRQYGYLAVQVKDDWQVTFGARQGVQQSEDLPAEMPRDDVVAGFVYYGQPYSLPAKITSLQTRTSVNPSFRLQVEPRQLVLDATFKYHVAGAKVFAIELDMADWQLDDTTLGPAGVVKAAGLVSSQGSNSALVPLQQAATGEVELTFKARRSIAADARLLDIRFPRAIADSFGEAEVSIVPNGNVVLTPRVGELVGLMAQAPAAAADDEPPEDRMPPRGTTLAYRIDAADARFVADFRLAERSVSARAETQINLSGMTANIEQKFSYSVANEPAESVLLDVPESLSQAAPVAVKLDGDVLETESVRMAPDDAGGTRLRVQFPEPRLGEFELTASYLWKGDAAADVPPLTTVRLEIPLIMPADECSSNEASVVCAPGLQVKPLGKVWTAMDDAAIDQEASAPVTSDAEGSAEQRRTAMRFVAASAAPELALAVRRDEQETVDRVMVERALVETTISEHARQDRAAFRFATAARRVGLRLPAGAAGVRYWLTTSRTARREITRDVAERADERTIPLPAAAEYVLELIYEVSPRIAPRGQQALELPRLLGQVSTRRGYWRLVLPSDELLLSGPIGWTPEFVWQRRWLAWSRRPSIDRAELDDWIGAASDERFVSTAGNRYLFSSIEPLGTLEIWTARRSLLVLAASGLVLALGLLWLYWPAVRRPVWLFIIGVTTLSAAAVWPDAALVWLQAAVLGGLLVLMSMLLQRSVARTPRQAAPYRSGSSSIVRPASTHTQARPLGAASPVSTETAAVVVESHLPEAAP
ncbi:MAG TPA: hypothetical protein VF306_22400 [Pirellulales bacterium]